MEIFIFILCVTVVCLFIKWRDTVSWKDYYKGEMEHYMFQVNEVSEALFREREQTKNAKDELLKVYRELESRDEVGVRGEKVF
jgi:hypothetical protein